MQKFRYFSQEYGLFGQSPLFCFVSQKFVVVRCWRWQGIFCETVKIFCEINENWNFHQKSCYFRGRDYCTFAENLLAKSQDTRMLVIVSRSDRATSWPNLQAEALQDFKHSWNPKLDPSVAIMKIMGHSESTQRDYRVSRKMYAKGFFQTLAITMLKGGYIFHLKSGIIISVCSKTRASRTTWAKGSNSFARNNGLQITDDHEERIRLQVWEL